jgi:hypothetical protein
MPLSGTRKLRLVVHAGIEVARRLLERAERPTAATVIPNTGCDDALSARHPRHLPQARDGIGHEVDDELRHGGVELAIFERQLLRCGASDLNPREAALRSFDEGL